MRTVCIYVVTGSIDDYPYVFNYKSEVDLISQFKHKYSDEFKDGEWYIQDIKSITLNNEELDLDFLWKSLE